MYIPEILIFVTTSLYNLKYKFFVLSQFDYFSLKPLNMKMHLRFYGAMLWEKNPHWVCRVAANICQCHSPDHVTVT